MAAGLGALVAGGTPGERLLNFLAAFRERKALALAVTATNIGGVAYGVFYYWDHFLDTAWYLLPFVPDSPVGPFLMVLVYGLWWMRGRRRSPLLELLAFCFLVKFGVWTVIMFPLYSQYFFTPEAAALSTTLFCLHIGEALEAGILLKGMRMPALPLSAFALGWILLGDFSDYVLATHPRVPGGAPVFAIVPFITVALTLISFLVAVGWCRHLAPPAPAGAARMAHEEDPGG
ncbi:MAG TPA: DUF1405 domain-containing protein [Candidatus Thermoplasmatota archaeon]